VLIDSLKLPELLAAVLDALNAAIRVGPDDLNRRPMCDDDKSRLEMFESHARAALRPLAIDRFEVTEERVESACARCVAANARAYRSVERPGLRRTPRSARRGQTLARESCTRERPDKTSL
jgi:hypothetical protein